MRTFLPTSSLFRLILPALLFVLSLPLAGQKTYSPAEVIQVLEQQDDLRLEAEDIKHLEISSQYVDAISGLTHVYLQQSFRGVPVKAGTIGLHFTAEGDLFYFTNNFVSKLADKVDAQRPALSATEGLKAALKALGMKGDVLRSSKAPTDGDAFVFDKSDYSTWDVPVRLVYEMTKDGELRLAWESRVYPLDQEHYWELSVSAFTGAELARVDRVVHCSFGGETHRHGADCHQETAAFENALPTAKNGLEQLATGANFYRVFDAPVEAPTFGERSFIGTGGDPTASPLGWHNDGLLDYPITRGNNVYAYQDPGPGSTGIPAVGGTPGQQPLVFDFEADLSLTPVNYRDAAITNLFYWNNKIHDIFYHYGFTEAAGNFQNDNFANGGEALDGVLAEAQDGSGVNNANFLTLEDGLPGRMQMFLWTGVPIIDGDFDNGVILHEYGHGISTRLTGGPGSTCLSGDEQGGEGWSDYFGMMVTMQPNTVPGVFSTGRGMGTYVVGEGTDGDGIRPAKYSTDFSVNDYTYADLTRTGISAPHGVGFIWATMLWEMTAKLVEVYGYDNDVVFGTGGNNMALQLVMTGLTLQPCGPTFVEQRDAILAADQLLYGGANRCLIWEAFAKRGLGFSASSGTNTRGDEVAAFDMPPLYCLPTVDIATEASSIAVDGQTTQLSIIVTNNSTSTINDITVTEQLPAGTSIASASHPYTQSGSTVSFPNVSVNANSSQTVTIDLALNTGSTAAMLHRDDLESDPFGFTPSPGLNQFGWSTGDAYSGNYSFFAADPNNASNQLLTWNQEITPVAGTHLRFAHRFNTEANFDGGLVEVSADGGTTWTDLGPLFVQHGYNNLVTAADNPLINGFCFGGNSGGFIHSVVNLSLFQGQTIQVRFRFSSDVATGGEGWYIDDLEIVNDPMVIENTAGFSMAGGFITGTSVDNILVLGSNNGFNAPAAPKAGVAKTDFNLSDATELNISPNPARSTTTLRLSGNSLAPAQLSVLNATGKEMYRQQEISTESAQIELDVAQWPAGIYFVRLLQGEQLTTRKLIID